MKANVIGALIGLAVVVGAGYCVMSLTKVGQRCV